MPLNLAVFCFSPDSELCRHRKIERQKERQRLTLIFWLFDAAGGGVRGYCETKFLGETHGNMMGFEPVTFR